MLYRSDGKFRSLVNRTKRAAIPWTVPRYTNKQAVCLAWWSYRPLFKTVVLFNRFILKVHSDNISMFFIFLRKVHFYLYSYTVSLCLGNRYFLLTHKSEFRVSITLIERKTHNCLLLLYDVRWYI